MIGKRGGKVYLDFLQNRHAQLMVAPYSVPTARRDGFDAAALERGEPKLKMGDYTIANAAQRMEKLGEDPFRAVLTESRSSSRRWPSWRPASIRERPSEVIRLDAPGRLAAAEAL